MSAKLLLSLTQEDVKNPYKFSITGISVFSFEEALYHTFNYFKESVDDFLSEEFIIWVKNELKLVDISFKIAEIKKLESKVLQIANFLSLADYFDLEEIRLLSIEVYKWENQDKWKKLKDIADNFMKKKEYLKAYNYYKDALLLDKNIFILNNIAASLMHLGFFKEAVVYLTKALEIDKDNPDVLYNLEQALAYLNDNDYNITVLNSDFQNVKSKRIEGKHREYSKLVKNILNNFKKQYREVVN